jgi:hypothetical protein
MSDQVNNWLAATVLTLFCASVLYGGVAIQTLLNH